MAVACIFSVDFLFHPVDSRRCNTGGNIRTSTILDVETKTHYWLTVFAQDHGVVPLHARTDVYIQVQNVNDNVPMTLDPVYYAQIVENQSGILPIVQLAASDGDLDPDQRISYKISAGNPESYFNIDIGSGLISTTGRKLDRENQAEHVLEVTVTDDGAPAPLSSTTRVIISVEDVNDNAPEFEQNFYHVNIPETRHRDEPLSQTGSGESEATLEVLFENSTWENFHETNITGDFLFRVIAFDKDQGENARLQYDIKSGKGRGRFLIHPTTGAVLSSQSFVAGQEFDLLVRATDHGSPNQSSTARVSIQVVRLPDESKNPPTIKSPDQRVEVTENDAVGFLVALIQASDPDGDTLWYRIVDGDPNSTFSIGNDKGNVLLARRVDWETQPQYTLNISVSDGIHTVYTKLHVTVVDVNEHRPILTQSLYETNISESVPVGSEILKVAASDSDQESKVLYSIHHAQSPLSAALFRIDFHSGALSVAQPLDRESLSHHLLTIMARDQGTPAKRNFARVSINVLDSNDHPPEFATSLVKGRVFETSAVGTNIVQVVATDRDHGENGVVTYSITSGNIGNVFTMDPILGTIQTARPLDLSLMSEYMLLVKATDQGAPPLAATVPVQIIVVMADNDPPRFAKAELAAELFENEPPGTVVRHIEARSTSSLVFEIIRGDSDDMFSINPSTGVLLTKKPLDYEATRIYNLSVTATNMAGAKAVCSVIVHILDRNDNTPYFTQLNYTGYVSEAAPIGALVLTNTSLPLVIRAEDKDSETNALLEYSAIRTVVNLDHESLPRIEFHVQVTDLGRPRLTSDTLAKVIVEVTDTNDCPPQFSQDVYNVSILVPTFTNVAVLQLNATDADSSNLTKLVYSVESGNDAHIYSLAPDTGLITLKEASLGAKTAPHALKVAVKDGRFTSYATVNIAWAKSENSGLTFQRPLYQGSVLENATKVITVAVVNVIGSALNEYLEFSILNPTPLFQIGRTSGALRTTGVRFDRETQEEYQLIVQAKSEDKGPKSSTISRVAHVPVNITVLDKNDNCPMFVNQPYYAVVPVDALKGGVITKVHAIDLDKGENSEVRYELSKGHGELFKVDRNNGEISLKQVLEGHNREYVLHISAFDKGIQPCSTEVSVNVKVIDKSMPVFDKQFYSVSVREDIQIHSPLPLTIRAESPLNRKLIYSITGGNSREQFAVDFNTVADGNNGPCEYRDYK
ncbi:hypothetical protein M8J75_000237 [Diaphorina citri]|nr:hypothetical protein M8J75_000237 [Diaphorina citri]